ncbi:MAG: diacylglycerol kinase family lipid kinase [Calditrichia bacterium]
MTRIRFIINPKSGIHLRPQKILKAIQGLYPAESSEVDIQFTEGPGDGTRLARKAVEEGINLLIAVGGDGTINEIGRGLIYSQTVLGIVPTGSGNGFARNFHIPLNQLKALELLKSYRTLDIDVGKLNDHYFFNVAGMGLDAIISQKFEDFGIRGPLPYFLTGTQSFLKYVPETVHLTFNNKELEFAPLLLSIANAPQYGNGAIIAPSADPTDGLLDLIILDNLSFFKAAGNIYRLFNGTVDQIEGFHSFKVDRLLIRRPAAGVIHTDGNPHQEQAVLQIEVLPKALKLAVPLS